MIGALIQGELVSEPVQRIASNGTPFTTATVRVPAGAEAMFIGIAAFDAVAAERLSKLHKGSPVAAAGAREANDWQTKDGEARRDCRLTAAEFLSVSPVRKRRTGEDRPSPLEAESWTR